MKAKEILSNYNLQVRRLKDDPHLERALLRDTLRLTLKKLVELETKIEHSHDD